MRADDLVSTSQRESDNRITDVFITDDGHQAEDDHLVKVVRGIVELAKIDQPTVAQLARHTQDHRFDHVQGEVAGDGAGPDPPQHDLIKMAGTFFDGKEEAPDGRPEGGRHPGGGAAGHKVPLVRVVSKFLIEPSRVGKRRGFSLKMYGVHETKRSKKCISYSYL